jgi:hypothetical protein
MTMGILHLRSRRLAAAAGALALFGFTTAGCSAVTAGSYLNTQVELTRYATFGWGAADETPTGDPRLDNNPFFNDRVRAEVGRGLSARGYALAPSGTPDLVVHVHTSVTQEIDIPPFDQSFCAEGDCRPTVYDAGTLVVDLVEGATGTLVWRGWADSAFGEVINSQPAMERRIDESVAQILARLPGRL